MTSEMDLLRMDERQRLSWLMANRGTLVAVGIVWLGMLVWEIAHDRPPVFLVVMVPVFGLLRLALYKFYVSTPVELDRSIAQRPLGRYLGIAAGALLLISAFLPFYSVSSLPSDAPPKVGYTWQIVLDDWMLAIPLAIAFLWPIPHLFVARFSGRRSAILLQLMAPFLASLSSLIILWLPGLFFDFRPLLWILVWTVVPARADAGCYLAIASNGLFVLVWLTRWLGLFPVRPQRKGL
jgi:hypothetical protein